MRLAQSASRERHDRLPGKLPGLELRHDHLVSAVRDLHRPVPDSVLHAPGRRDVPPHAACRAAAVRERQRHLERVARRDEARRVRLDHELRRDLPAHGRRARGFVRPRDGRDAHLADELRQLELHAGAPASEAYLVLPQRERLEPARGHGAYAPEHVGVAAAAGLHSARAQSIAADDGQYPPVEIEERMVRAAHGRQLPDRIRRLLVGE